MEKAHDGSKTESIDLSLTLEKHCVVTYLPLLLKPYSADLGFLHVRDF